MGDSRERPVNHRPDAGDRAVTPSVGKALEGGIVVLFVGLLTTMLLGGLVPDYRAATGAELGDRVLATASQEVERAVPPTARAVDARRSVDLPSSIAGEGYKIRTDGRWLVLDHPDPASARSAPPWSGISVTDRPRHPPPSVSSTTSPVRLPSTTTAVSAPLCQVPSTLSTVADRTRRARPPTAGSGWSSTSQRPSVRIS